MTMSPAFEAVQGLKEAGLTLATAESCTGGGIGAAVTAVPGSSKVFLGGIISYTNEIKARLLGVSRETLETFGAVSGPVAEQMAAGARKALGVDLALSVTGLAGPDGDEYGNPVGTVFLGFASESGTFAREYHFSGDREAVREAAVLAALALLEKQMAL